MLDEVAVWAFVDQNAMSAKQLRWLVVVGCWWFVNRRPLAGTKGEG